MILWVLFEVEVYNVLIVDLRRIVSVFFSFVFVLELRFVVGVVICKGLVKVEFRIVWLIVMNLDVCDWVLLDLVVLSCVCRLVKICVMFCVLVLLEFVVLFGVVIGWMLVLGVVVV